MPVHAIISNLSGFLKMMNKKASILIVIVIIAIIALWQAQTIRNPAITASENEIVIESDLLKATDIAVSNASNSSATTGKGILNESDIRDINKANEQNIASPAFSQSDYAMYDEATLERMADSGDVSAMKALWVKYLKSDDVNDVEKMRQLVTKAIVYGDRDMFQHMPELSSLSDRFTNPEASPEQKHNAMIDLLAYHEFMGMRGNLSEKYSGQEVFFIVHSTPEAPIKLTAADKAAILARAREIYANYEGERMKLGLGPFDNSVPDGLKKLYEMQRESYLQAMGDNAI
ncbi:hypothetical protein CJA_3097 [Cellvibrio japonicus Ueda107]|uniref:Uncharacterized protein n=2 Tax=Cellvibrio japonicus TaxID=155077 RepID=B3PDD9_CELJU|nr:hypothetical protein CJA_3097 [Cellvibrio japonicus Ueda107]